MPKRIEKLTVKRLRPGQTEIEEQVFEDVVEYGFPSNGAFFYIKSRGTLSTDIPGSFNSTMEWIPVAEIKGIDGGESIKFLAEPERQMYVEKVLGEKYPTPATDPKKN